MSRPKLQPALLMNDLPLVLGGSVLFRTTVSAISNCRPAGTMGKLSHVRTLPMLVNVGVGTTGVPSSTHVMLGVTPVALRSSTTLMLCSSLGDPWLLMTMPLAGSYRIGILIVQVKGTPM